MTTLQTMATEASEHGSAMAVPDGSYLLSAAMDDALRGACGAPARGADGVAHPAFAFVMALGGMGVDVATLCARFGLPFDTGAMLGRCRLRYARPLAVDVRYLVQARLVTRQRKPSRRFGAAEHLTLAMALSCAGVLHAEVELTMIVPLRLAGAA